MHTLAADDIIRVWELGQRHNSTEQAVATLAAAFPEKSGDELWRLSLGQRNACLLAVRERLFGPELEAFTECPDCGQQLEFSLSSNELSSSELRSTAPVETSDMEFNFESEGYKLRFRLLNSVDLKAAADSGDVSTAVKLLLERCVLQAHREEAAISVAELPEAVVEQLAAQLAAYDPQAEVQIDLACPGCGFKWRAPFDIASFIITEIGACARRLMGEVHTLARAYGWSEQAILAMSGRRRQYYLEMLGQ
jgi:hypothetical protein